MTTQEQIKQYINGQPDPKRTDLEILHQRVLELMPKCKLWFLDGKDENGKVVSNPSIGYGAQLLKYADGKIKAFYQVGISANTNGISVYIMGLADKKYLPDTYGKTIGRATVTGYCIKFRGLAAINTDVLEQAMQDGIKKTAPDRK